MKRFHVHVAVDDLERNLEYYTALFGVAPTVKKQDYAKWMLDDPGVNFAISARGAKAGIDHLGFQVEEASELAEVEARLERASELRLKQEGASCCYAQSDKVWATDPQGIAWETFHTLSTIPVFGAGNAKGARQVSKAACCGPASPEGLEGLRNHPETRCC